MNTNLSNAEKQSSWENFKTTVKPYTFKELTEKYGKSGALVVMEMRRLSQN